MAVFIVVMTFGPMLLMLTAAAVVSTLAGQAHPQASAASPKVGVIEGVLKTEQDIEQAWLVHRHDTTDGVKFDQIELELDDDGAFRAANLRTTGFYAVKLRTSKGTIIGWDATVPPSDYVEEQPLSEESIDTIGTKLAGRLAGEFSDEVKLLDIQGNVQNAAVLITKLRRRPFVGGDYKPGEWVWRVERWQFEDPYEDSWAPWQERPYYTRVRRRLTQSEYEELAIVYARHLGGIALTAEQPVRKLGTLKIPMPVPGIHACEPDGSLIEPTWLKPRQSRADTPTDRKESP